MRFSRSICSSLDFVKEGLKLRHDHSRRGEFASSLFSQCGFYTIPLGATLRRQRCIYVFFATLHLRHFSWRHSATAALRLRHSSWRHSATAALHLRLRFATLRLRHSSWCHSATAALCDVSRAAMLQRSSAWMHPYNIL